MRAFLVLGSVLCLAGTLLAQVTDVRVTGPLVAGSSFSVFTAGSGKATLYLVGPSRSAVQEVQLGQDVPVTADETATAGRYLAIVCSQECRSAAFDVIPAKAASLSFLAHPSRVPVHAENAISGVAMAFDEFHNLVLEPLGVEFKLAAGGKELSSRRVQTQNGVAWFRSSSSSGAGGVQLTASSGALTANRLVRQVAGEACNLRVKATRSSSGITLETDPVRDCAGNLVPDGTIVTFTKTSDDGKSTVDAPVKQGIARARMISSQGVISVASGIVMGSSIRVGN
jgi:hypothetical protein